MKLFYNFDNDGNTFEYEVSAADVERAVLTFPGGRQQWIHCAESDDDLEELKDFYEDELIDYFYEDAKETYRDNMELTNNPDSYYGVSRKD